MIERLLPAALLIAIVRVGPTLACPAITTDEVDACGLLTSLEISQVIGRDVRDGVEANSGLQSNGAYSASCVWKVAANEAATTDSSATPRAQEFLIVHVMQFPADSGRAHEFLDSFRSAGAAGELPSQLTPRHFGDEALSWGDGLAVRKLDTGFGISLVLNNFDRPARARLQEQLAPKILRRISDCAAKGTRRDPAKRQ